MNVKMKNMAQFIVLSIVISSCNLPGGQAPVDQNPPPGDQQPPPLAASNTSEFTLTPSNTPLPTFTFTPSTPLVSV